MGNFRVESIFSTTLLLATISNCVLAQSLEVKRVDTPNQSKAQVTQISGSNLNTVSEKSATAAGAAGASSTAQNPKAGEAVSKPADSLQAFPNGVDNYIGDHVWYSYDKFVQRADMGIDPITLSPACLPALSRIRGKGKASSSTNDTGVMFQVISVPAGVTTCTPSAIVSAGDIILLRSADLKVGNPYRSGFAYGTLLVPYKYHFKGDRSFGEGASLGGYFGWRGSTNGVGFVRDGIELQGIGFLGATTKSVKQTKDGKEQSLNLTGVSFGVGILGEIKDSFQIGFIVGQDKFNKGSPYENNGKFWAALSLGYTISK